MPRGALENRCRAGKTRDCSLAQDSTQTISAGRGQAYAYLVRSPHPHAKIAKIDVALAIGGPGVIAVLTGSDAAGDGLKPIPHSPVPTNPHEVPLRNRDGSGFFIAPHPVLALDAVRYVGEPVAIVVAQTLAEAIDAAESVEVVYEPVTAVARSRDASSPGAPLVGTAQLQCVRRLRGGRQGGHRGRFREGGPYRSVGYDDQP